jgi:hydroxyacylglutathione hydrolase
MEEKRFGPVLFIPGSNRGRYPNCNSIYIEGVNILVDPGSDRDRLRRLREQYPVDRVWLTHFHEDHIGYLDLFDDLPLWISEEDARPLSSLEAYLDFDWYENSDAEKQFWIQSLVEHFNFRPRTPAGFLKESDKTTQGGVTVEVIRCPGHTLGSLSFYIPEAHVLFTGDYDLTPFGPYYGDRGSNIVETIASIERLQRTPSKVVLTGHEKGIFEDPSDAIWERYLEPIYIREQKLLELLSLPKTLREIIDASIVYGKQRKRQVYFEAVERVLMKKHLELLCARRMVVQEGERFRRIL